MDNNKKYDLEDRTEKFSIGVRDFCIAIKKDVINIVYLKQLVRSAGSIGANYIEANDNLGSNDLKMRIRICRKKAKNQDTGYATFLHTKIINWRMKDLC